MKLATWNVNSVRSRLERLLAWLANHQPDVLCLQELKGLEDVFPFDAIRQAGYHAAVYGEKTYNGVAILSRSEPTDIHKGLPGDDHARLIAATVDGVRIVSVYVPNGREVGCEHWHYKLDWLKKLSAWLAETAKPTDRLAVCGDFNVAPDDADVANPESWADSVLCHPDIRKAFQTLTRWPLVDVFGRHHPEGGVYSWWDYRRLAFQKGIGLRLDHILATKPLAAQCTAATIDRDERKGEKPSDHAPVIATFELQA